MPNKEQKIPLSYQNDTEKNEGLIPVEVSEARYLLVHLADTGQKSAVAILAEYDRDVNELGRIPRFWFSAKGTIVYRSFAKRGMGFKP